MSGWQVSLICMENGNFGWRPPSLITWKGSARFLIFGANKNVIALDLFWSCLWCRELEKSAFHSSVEGISNDALMYTVVSPALTCPNVVRGSGESAWAPKTAIKKIERSRLDSYDLSGTGTGLISDCICVMAERPDAPDKRCFIAQFHGVNCEMLWCSVYVTETKAL